MQSSSFTYYSTFLMVATLIVLTRCDTPTTTVAATPPVSAASSETPLGNNHPATDTMVQNDDSKVEVPSVTPTRLPTSDAATLSPKPSIIHDVTSTQSTATATTLNNTTPMVNGNGTMGNMAAKKGAGNGSSKGSPGFMVMTTIILIVSAIYA